jgi:hypothetical protein
VKYADQRQQYLIDQGFFFEVVQELPFMKWQQSEREKKLIFSKDKDQSDHL